MAYILDISLIAIFVIACIAGVKKGIVQSLIDFLGSIISIILAYAFSMPISVWIYENLVQEGLYQRVYETAVNSTPEEIVAAIYTPLPEFIKTLLTEQGVSESTILSNANGIAETASLAVVDSLSPVFILIIKFFVVIILFILFLVIIKIIGSLIAPVLKLPGLTQVNGLLGGVFGLLFSFIVVWIILALISFGIYFLDSQMTTLVESFIEQSIIFKYIVSLNPFMWILS